MPSAKTYKVIFLAHGILLPENVGSLFRIADALGVESILLSGNSVVPPNAKLRKVSRATEKHVHFRYKADPLSALDDLKSKGYRIVSLELSSSSIDLETLVLAKDEKVCLVVGSEKTGVPQEILDVSDVTVHIPMLGKNSSMNVANACAIAAYSITKKIN